jgi:hypothetical protein
VLCCKPVNSTYHESFFYSLVPCSFNTSLSIDVGGKTVDISPASFNLGPIFEGSTTCVAGAAAATSLNGGELTYSSACESAKNKP